MKKIYALALSLFIAVPVMSAVLWAKPVQAEPCSDVFASVILSQEGEEVPCDPDDDGGGSGGGGSSSGPTMYASINSVRNPDGSDNGAGANAPYVDVEVRIVENGGWNGDCVITGGAQSWDLYFNGALDGASYDTTFTCDDTYRFRIYNPHAQGVQGSDTIKFVSQDYETNVVTVYLYTPVPAPLATASCSVTDVASSPSPHWYWETLNINISTTNAYNCYVSYDSNTPYAANTTSGAVNLTPYPASRGDHTGRVTCYNADGVPAYGTCAFNVLPMSGTLTPSAPSCTIPAGGTTCSIGLSWNVVSPDFADGTGTYITKSPSSTHLSDLYGATNFPVSVGISGGVFYLWHNGTLLDGETLSAGCGANNAWNLYICDAGTLSSASSCTITSGNSSCNVDMTWNRPVTQSGGWNFNISAPGMATDTFSVGGPDSGTRTYSVPHGSRTFTLKTANSDVVLSQKTVTASCASGTSWTGTACVPVVNGVCSATHYGCSSGTSANNMSNTDDWTWSCNGSNGGASPSCSETKYANLVAFPPTVTPATLIAGDTASFSATITNAGDKSTGASFSNFFQVATAADGGGTITGLSATTMTALAAGASGTTAKSHTFSSAGTYSVRACADKSSATDTGTVTESFENNNCSGWVTVTVSPVPVNGSCSATHYSCSAGTSASNADDGTTWTWSCNGLYGGTNASCSESRPPVNGVCGTTHYSCSAGTSASNVDGSNAWTWSCTGQHGGTSPSCSENKVPGVCGSSHYSCSVGISAEHGNGPTSWTWACYSPNGANSDYCAETKYPDLTAGGVTPTGAVVATPITLSSTISNTGDASTGSSFSNFFQVATASGGGGTITSLSPSTMQTVASGATRDASVSYTFPTVSTYSVRACADKSSATNAGTIAESNENNNCGAWTDITVANQPPPTAPSGLTAEAISKTGIDLEWNDNSSGETSFLIERKTGASGSWAQIGTTNPNKEDYSDTGLTADTLYYYRVRATNSFSESTYTNEASATTDPNTATIVVNVTPDNATWTINPGNIQRTGDTSVTVNPANGGTSYSITEGSAPSGYDSNPTITISQLSGCSSPCRSITLFDAQSANYIVTYARSFNYTLSNSGTMNVQKGGGSYVAHGQTTITKALTADSGPTKSVDLSVSGLPSGVSLYSFSGNPAAPNSSSVIDLAVSASAVAGTYPITVTGAPLGKTTTFNLVITNSPEIFVSCAATGTRQVGQEITWTASVTQTPSEAPYDYYWTGTNVPTSPAPSSASFPITYSTTGQKTANVLVTDSKGNTGVCNPAGTINIGVTPIFQEF